MELRVLQYFLAVAREQSILHAAESLHLSQPTPIQTAERAGGGAGQAASFVRSNRKITLTEEGMILRKRAAEILELVKKAENEIAWSNEVIAGDITLGAGETEGCGCWQGRPMHCSGNIPWCISTSTAATAPR